VVLGDCFGRLGKDRVVILYDMIGRQATVLFRQRHRAPRRMEAHADVAGGCDFRTEQVTRTTRVEIEVVGRGGATGQRELGETDPRTDVHGLFVDGRP